MDREILFLSNYKKGRFDSSDKKTSPLGNGNYSNYSKRSPNYKENDNFYPLIRSVRLKVAVLMVTCVLCTNLLRINLNASLPFMVNDTATVVKSEVDSNKTISPFYGTSRCDRRTGSYPGAHLFDWTVSVQTALLAASYWGEGLAILPAAYVAKNKGCKSVITVAVGFASLIAIFIPSAAFFGFYYVIILRFISGVALSFVFPGLLIAVKNWVPQHERTKLLLSFACGYCLSHIIGSPLISLLCAIPNSYGGWPIVFYLSSTFGFIWMVCWTLAMTNKPDRHQSIERKEKYYLSDCLKEDVEEIKIIANNISAEKNVVNISVIFAFSNTFIYFTTFHLLESTLLIYFKSELHLAVPNTILGFFDSIQYLTYSIFLLLFNMVAEITAEKFDISLATQTSVYGAFGSVAFGLGCLILPFVPCNHPGWVLLFLCFIYSLSASYGSSFLVSIFRYVHLQKYWTYLIVANCFGNVGVGFCITLFGLLQDFVGYTWKSCFIVLSIIILLIGILLLIFCSVSKSNGSNALAKNNNGTTLIEMNSINKEFSEERDLKHLKDFT